VTVVFAALLVAVGAGTAYLTILSPQSRIIPIALGVLGYTYGSLLGIFLLGALTHERGSERGNLVGIVAGIVAVALFSGLAGDALKLAGLEPAWLARLPVLAFPWRILLGTGVTFGIGACFRTHPEPVLARHRAPARALTLTSR
jgi:hypothetical protein